MMGLQGNWGMRLSILYLKFSVLTTHEAAGLDNNLYIIPIQLEAVKIRFVVRMQRSARWITLNNKADQLVKVCSIMFAAIYAHGK